MVLLEGAVEAWRDAAEKVGNAAQNREDEVRGRDMACTMTGSADISTHDAPLRIPTSFKIFLTMYHAVLPCSSQLLMKFVSILNEQKEEIDRLKRRGREEEAERVGTEGKKLTHGKMAAAKMKERKEEVRGSKSLRVERRS